MLSWGCHKSTPLLRRSWFICACDGLLCSVSVFLTVFCSSAGKRAARLSWIGSGFLFDAELAVQCSVALQVVVVSLLQTPNQQAKERRLKEAS